MSRHPDILLSPAPQPPVERPVCEPWTEALRLGRSIWFRERKHSVF